jgi:hypothetical protein
MQKSVILGAILGAGVILASAACGGPRAVATAPGSGSVANPPAAADPAVAAAAPVSAGDQAADRCHAGNLSGELHLFTPPGQAGSEQDAELGLTNTTNRPCVVYGYPGLQLIGADGRAKLTNAVRNTGKPPQNVTLRPGATAWSLLAWRFTPAADEADTSPLCGGTMTALKVIPPDETTQLSIPANICTVCDHGQIVTSAMQATRPSTAGPGECRIGQLDISVTSGDAGSGHRSRVLVFRNTGGSTCVLQGYPGVAGLDGTGHQVAQAQRTLNGYLGGVRTGNPPLVRLAPGTAASATVEALAFDAATGASCTPYAGLLVTPPDETHSVHLGWGSDGCSDLQIHPVVAGTTGQSS